MSKWFINYHDSINGIFKHCTIKAESKQEAIQKAIEKYKSHNLNNYRISLASC